MRILKFRAWAYSSKIMFTPDSDDGWNMIDGVLIPLPNTTVMQYTGLKDKNGKEIYEGDFVARQEHDGCEVYFEAGKIVWYESSWCIQFIDETLSLEEYYPETGMIIGNIHENSELLNV